MNQRHIAFLSGCPAAKSVAIALVMVGVLSCKADLKTGPEYGPVTIVAIQGDGQSTTVGTAVAIPPAVLVSNELGAPVANVPVTFTVKTGGGSITGNTATTGPDGIAALAGWSLGTTAGANIVSAVAAGLERHPAVLTATGVAGAPARIIELAPTPDTVQNALPFTTQPALQVSDQYGNAVGQSGVSITANLVAGNGTLQGTATIPSAASGAAQFTDLSILGLTGTYTLAFTGPDLPAASNDLHLVAGHPETLALLTQPAGTARSGVQLSQQPVLGLRDVSNNPVPLGGVIVVVTVASGGGGVRGTSAVASDTAGIQRFTDLAITGQVGTKVLQFSAPGLTGINSAPINVTAGPAALLSKTAGDNQLAAVGTAVAINPVVTVTDGSGNPVAGVVVVFTITSGGGHTANASVSTNAQGNASGGAWTLGPVVGGNTLSAVVFAVQGSPAVFTATGSTVIGPPAQLLSIAGDGQSAVAGTILAESLVVRLVDANGKGVAGVPVNWTAQSGGGSLGPAAVVTDGDGRLAASWTLGVSAGSNSALAQAAGFQVTFVASGVAAPAARLALLAAPSTAQSGIPFVTQPAVALQDSNGRPVAQANVIITAAIAGGGGSLSGKLTATTNAQGDATFSNLTLTGLIGPRVLTLSAPGVSPVSTGTIQVSAGTAADLTEVAGDGQSAVVGSAVAIDPSVQVTDGAGNPVDNVTVDFAVSGGGGSIANSTATTNAQGIASGGPWTLGPVSGSNSLTVTSAGLNGSPAVFTATGEPNSLTTILLQPVAAFLLPNGRQVFTASCRSNGALFPCPDLTWTVTGGTWAGAPVVPDTTGTFTAGNSPGAFSVTASSAGVSGVAPVTIAASVPANVTVNPLVQHQVIDGWEATAADGFSVTQSTLNALISAAANDLGITRLRLEATGNKIESRDGITGTNDNNNAAILNAAGFLWGPWDQKITDLVIPLKRAVEARGDKFILNVCYVGYDTSAGFQQVDPAEYVEFVLAVLNHLKQTFGLEPDIWEVRLEPNTPDYTIDKTTETAMLAAAAVAVRQAGFTKVMFAAPSTSDAGTAVGFFTNNITAPNASQYLRELVYHRYGSPTQTMLNGIRTAALNFGAHTAMLEHIGADQDELYDDLTQADVSSWQQFTLAFSGPDVGGKYYVVNAAGTGFSLGSRTKYLRQYFHYVRPGDRRVDATSTSATIRPVAFVKPNGTVVVVANTTAAATLAIAGLPAGTYQVSYTTAGQAGVIGTTSTIVAGQVLPAAIPAAGVITIAPQ